MPRNRKSRRRNVRLHCEPKTAFATQMHAMRAGAKAGLNWYRCPYCHKWHLTSKNTPKHHGKDGRR